MLFLVWCAAPVWGQSQLPETDIAEPHMAPTPEMFLVPWSETTLLVGWQEGADERAPIGLRSVDMRQGHWSSDAIWLNTQKATTDATLGRLLEIVAVGAERFAVLGVRGGELVLIQGASQKRERLSHRVLISLAEPMPKQVRALTHRGRIIALLERSSHPELDKPFALVTINLDDDTVTLEDTPWYPKRDSNTLVTRPVACGERLFVAWRAQDHLSVGRMASDGTPVGRTRIPIPKDQPSKLSLTCASGSLALFSLSHTSTSLTHLNDQGEALDDWITFDTTPDPVLAVTPFADIALLVTRSPERNTLETRIIDPANPSQSQPPEPFTPSHHTASTQLRCALYAEELACFVHEPDAEWPELHMLTRDNTPSTTHLDLAHVLPKSSSTQNAATLVECGSVGWEPFEAAVVASCQANTTPLCDAALESLGRCVGAPSITLRADDPLDVLLPNGDAWLQLAFSRKHEGDNNGGWKLSSLQEVQDIACGSPDFKPFADAVARRCAGQRCEPLVKAFNTCRSPWGTELFPIERHDAVLASSLYYFIDDHELLFSRKGSGWRLAIVRTGYNND